MSTFDDLKKHRELWINQKSILVECSWCQKEFEVKNGTFYNIIRRNSDGVYCHRKCAGAARAYSTQNKYKEAGGKTCKRCGEFQVLHNFSSLPNPPYYRAECKRCHNYKPARQFSSLKEKALFKNIGFYISLDQYLEILNQDCYYCGQCSKNNTLELIDSTIGFQESNIILCCRKCQKLKGDLTHQDFIINCLKITEHLQKRGINAKKK